jgi:small-conductance mechanosensitive channel
MVNPIKQHRKLMGLGHRAQSCLSRDEAQKLIRKAEKANRKLRRFLNGQARDGQLEVDQRKPRSSWKDRLLVLQARLHDFVDWCRSHAN